MPFFCNVTGILKEAGSCSFGSLFEDYAVPPVVNELPPQVIDIESSTVSLWSAPIIISTGEPLDDWRRGKVVGQMVSSWQGCRPDGLFVARLSARWPLRGKVVGQMASLWLRALSSA